MKKQLLAVLAILVSGIAFAQKGMLAGTVTDKDLNNEALPFANVLAKGTPNAATADDHGKYAIPLAPGTYEIEYSFLGYETKTQTVTIVQNDTTKVDISLGAGSYTLKDVQVQAQASRQKETALLLEQKNAVEIKQNIGAQELSRKGVSDVAAAVVKTTGVSKQEGSGSIFVRGLGDRYNATTMNGLPIPSNDAEKKNIALEIFPTEIVDYVSIDKVYSSRIYGDFAGGNIDIASKEHKGKGFVRVDIGANANTNAVSEDSFRLHAAPNASGFGKAKIPSDALESYGFETLRMDAKSPTAGNFGISAGNSWTVGNEGKFSAFGTISFANEFSSIKNGKANGSISPTGVVNKRYDSWDSRSYNTNTTALANLGYKFNPKHKINLNSLFINTSDQQTDEYRGYVVDVYNDGNGFTRINTFTQTALFVNQLLGEHRLNERLKIDWAAGYNKVSDSQPDRTWNMLNQTDGGYTINAVSVPNNNRYFQDLGENEFNGMASAAYKIFKSSEEEYKGKLTIGYNGRMKKRNFEATQFNFRILPPRNSDVVDAENLDAFFNQQNLSDGFFEIRTFRGGAQVPNALKPQTYDGELEIHAGFASLEYEFSPKLTAVVGLRTESISQSIDFNTALNVGSGKLDKTGFLPSVIVKYEMNEKQNLRFAFSKTYTLPQFKETALFAYERATQVYFGNPDLYESDNYNLDLKWEMFPAADELVSATAFGKYIANPINEFVTNSSTNDISWANTGDYGYAAGIEIEARKNIFKTEGDNSKKLSAGINLSYLHTEQELSSEKVNSENRFVRADFTNSKSEFAGASNWLGNADVSYFAEWNGKKSNLTATVAYNLFSDRIFALGTQTKGNLVDKSVGTLDFILKSKINENLGFGLTAKNLTNPKIEQVQENANGDVLSQAYRKGLGLSIGVNYQF